MAFRLLRARLRTGRSSPGQTASTLPLPRPALGRTISFTDYQDAVSKALSQVQTAESAAGTDRANAIKNAIATLSNVEGASVSPAQAGSVPSQVDNSVVIAALGKDPPDLKGTEQSLSALSDALSRPTGTSVQGTLDGQLAASLSNLADTTRPQAGAGGLFARHRAGSAGG